MMPFRRMGGHRKNCVIAVFLFIALPVAVGSKCAAFARTSGGQSAISGMSSKQRPAGGAYGMPGLSHQSGGRRGTRTMAGLPLASTTHSAPGGGQFDASTFGRSQVGASGSANVARSTIGKRPGAKGVAGAPLPSAVGRNTPDWNAPSSWPTSALYQSPWKARTLGYAWGATAR